MNDNRFPLKDRQLKQLREKYPVGARLEPIHMDEPDSRKLGSGLGLIPGGDEFKKS